MNRLHSFDFSENDLSARIANLDPCVLDEEAWEDATDASGIDGVMLSQGLRHRWTLDAMEHGRLE